jgi:hypothetical protein
MPWTLQSAMVKPVTRLLPSRRNRMIRALSGVRWCGPDVRGGEIPEKNRSMA